MHDCISNGNGAKMKLMEQIELTRIILHETSLLYGIGHVKVLEVSQELDVLINEFYKQKELQF